jgi:hypothetical protein
LKEQETKQMWLWQDTKEDTTSPHALHLEVIRQVKKNYRSLNHLKLALEYYPYRDVKITSRIRDGKIIIRLGDCLAQADSDIIEAAVRILLEQLKGRKAKPEYHRRFIDFAESDHVRSFFKNRDGGRKTLHRPQGNNCNLEELFHLINNQYFSGQLPMPSLAWCVRSKTRLGAFYPDQDRIAINSALDHPNAPRLLLEFVMYHEMLHKKHGYKQKKSRRHFHTREFRQDEKAFNRYAEAIKLSRKAIKRK